MEELHPGQPPKALESALRRLLRPLVRLLLAHQITFPYLSNLLKSVFVSVADSDFAVSGKRQTDSRIHLLTGVHRKDVRRIRGETATADVPPKTVSLGGQIIATWTGSAPYSDEAGKPRPLSRLAKEGEQTSFEELVTSISKQDFRARAVLDELVRLGVVRVDEEDYVHLCMEAFIPDKGFDEKAYYFGQNVRDHIAAGAHNLVGEKPPFLDRSVYYGGLSAESVAELADMSETLGMKALQEVNRRATQFRKADKEKGLAAKRINFGIFFYSDDKNESSGGEKKDA